MNNNDLDDILNKGKELPDQVLSNDDKIKILYKKISDKREQCKSLNARVKRLDYQLSNIGCSINGALALDFTLINDKAIELENRLKQVKEYIKTKSNVTEVDTLYNIIDGVS